jgi:hypothetical protein
MSTLDWLVLQCIQYTRHRVKELAMLWWHMWVSPVEKHLVPLPRWHWKHHAMCFRLEKHGWHEDDGLLVMTLFFFLKFTLIYQWFRVILSFYYHSKFNSYFFLLDSFIEFILFFQFHSSILIFKLSSHFFL